MTRLAGIAQAISPPSLLVSALLATGLLAFAVSGIADNKASDHVQVLIKDSPLRGTKCFFPIRLTPMK